MKLYANLHTHSTHSDGVFTPTEMVKIAKDEGYGAIALADHDTVTGYSELKAVAEAEGLETIFGCEFTAYCAEINFHCHITAYGFDPEYPEMKEYLRRCGVSITEQTRILFERGISDGLIPNGISWQDVLDYNKGIGWLCNDHVFRTMKHLGLATDLEYPAFFANVYGKRRREVKLIYDFLPIEELIPLIKAAGGIAFIAHPHNRIPDIPTLIKYGISGLEVWHSNLTPEERVEGLKLARDYKLFISGGSDHEGLCGGQYAFYEDPTTCEFYLPECSTGTTKEFFEEIKSRTLMPDRDEYINKYIEELI